MRTGILLLALLTLLPALAGGQEPSSQKRLLEARSRQIDLQRAQEEVERVERLLDQGVVSEIEVARVRSERDKTRLAFEQALLDLLSVRPRLTVREAVKLEDANGQPSVRLELINLTPAVEGSELELLEQLGGGGSLPESLASQTIRDVFVSLRDTGAPAPGNPSPMRGATIALPYEQRIPEIAYGDTARLSFELLRDVSSVLVTLSFAGQTQEIDLHLQQAASARPVRIASTQASQEADLGSEAVYDLRLTRSTVDVRGFRLETLGLPRQIGASFGDPATSARLSQVSFPAGVTERQLELRLFLPDRAEGDVRIDQPLEFWAVAVAADAGELFPAERRYTEEEIAASGAGAVRLAITPRGVGELEVAAVSFFSEVRAGEVVDLEVTAGNVGSRRIESVELDALGPLGWRVETEPEALGALEPGREARVRLTVTPPAEVAVGEYELRLTARGFAFDQRIESPEKIYRVSVAAPPRVLATALLLGVFLSLVVGVVVFGIRLTRR